MNRRAKNSEKPRVASIRELILLKYLHKAYESGHEDAAREALRFCAGKGIVPPKWIVAAAMSAFLVDDGQRKEGRPTRHPWVRILHIMAVKNCEQLPYGRGDQVGKYDRAARYLRRMNPKIFCGLPVLVSGKAIKASYLEFMRTGRLGYWSLSDSGALITRLCAGVDPSRIETAVLKLAKINKQIYKQIRAAHLASATSRLKNQP